MIEQLMMTALLGVAACSGFIVLAKRSAPITREDARVIWTMHRKTSGCNQRKLQFIKRRKDKIIGFKCACGYKYQQKRPLLSRMPKA